MRYLLAVTLAASLLAAWLFPRACPIVVLSDRIAREDALQSADSFVRAHALPRGARTAIRFQRSDSLLTFIELAGGGKDSLNALVKGNDVAPYIWSVRAFTPRDVHETRVHFAANGRLIGFQRRFAEADKRSELASDSAQRMAEHVLTSWLGESRDRWRLATSSYETRKTSARVDRTFTFERSDRRIADAPIRLDIVIAGDTPSVARRYVRIPDGFRRRYGEMRSANELYSLIATVALLGILVAGAAALRRFARLRTLRWRAPLAIGTVIAALLVGSGLNEIGSQWYDYDTATSPVTYQLILVIGVFAVGALAGIIAAVTLAVAEAATRTAFPDHLDWWGLWKYRGTREVVSRVLGGYALAAIALAYVVVFYLVTRKLFGWWVPSELLDDPNLIATPAPWLAGIAMSLRAAVWEEALFRALPLSLLSLWVGSRPRRALWMAGGVIASALVFGFAHANYPSWPAYSRGVEIFLDACLWAVVFLRFGIVVTVIAHFLYNATLFGLFAAGGSALSYRLTAAIIVLAILAPALIVAWRWMRQRGFPRAPAEARFGAWQPPEPDVAPVAVEPVTMTGLLGARARKVALGTIGLAIVVSLVTPAESVRGPEYTVPRSDATAVADSMAAARGVDVSKWERLAGTRTDTLIAWPRFLRHHKREALATTLATTYAIPAWWEVRYVRPAGNVSERAEEWRARVRPDGVPLGMQHIVPDSAPGARPSQSEVRGIARAELVRTGLDTAVLVETKLEETARPSRLDVTVTYTDSTVRLPAGAAARVWVSLAGVEPVLVRRGIELPEAFIREERDRMMRRGLVAALSFIILLTLVSVGALRVIRRRARLIEEAAMSRRARFAILGGVSAFILASALNDFPSTLTSYDTAETWSSFMTSTILGGVALTVLLVLFLAGLWLAVNALRLRVGIAVFPPPAPAGRMSDALLAGAALGSVFAIDKVVTALTSSTLPGPPDTTLGQAVPVLADVLSLPPSVLLLVPAVAIPLLLIAALTRVWRFRVLLGLVLVTLMAGIMLPATMDSMTPGRAAVTIFAVVALTLAIRLWGSVGVAAWIAAALAAHSLSGISDAVHAANVWDRWAHALGVIVALALLAFIGDGRFGYRRLAVVLSRTGRNSEPAR